MHLPRTAGFFFLSAGLAAQAHAASLVPHEAVYELRLAAHAEGIVAVDGRIALQLKRTDCDLYDLDYRFVARFTQDGETTLTDQRTVASETTAGETFTFETTTLVDGAEQGRVSGAASSRETQTHVSLAAPVERSFDLPLSRFPLQHTALLIDEARAGKRIVEARLFDGDENAEKLLTTTAIILPVSQEDSETARLEPVAGLRAWRIDESYFNADSDVDGRPIFHTRYTLYENGVTDDLFLDFGAYALEGDLSRLSLYDEPSGCAR